MTVPYTFANAVGALPLSELDANFAAIPNYANTAGIVVTPAQTAITSVGTLANLSVAGNVVTGGVVSATGNITGNYIIGNGSQLTGLPASYGNANVAVFLPTYTGNIAAGNISVTGNIIGNIAFDTAEGAATGFAATGNPFVAIGTAVVGGGMSIKNPVQVGNKIIDQNKLPSPIQGNASENQWATDVLKKVGAPVTSENLAALTTWMRFEGGGGGKATGLGKNSANWNPLNTTQGAPGSTSMNSVGVQSYLSKDQGLDATVKTLQNGNYGQVLSALKEGKSSSAVLAAVAASPWGTFQGARDTSGASISGGSKTVNINLTIGKASEAEATAFAKRIKELLMQDKDLSSMGSK